MFRRFYSNCQAQKQNYSIFHFRMQLSIFLLFSAVAIFAQDTTAATNTTAAPDTTTAAQEFISNDI